MTRILLAVGLLVPALALAAMRPTEVRPTEVRQRLDVPEDARAVALTLDACSGAFDADLVRFLALYRIQATIFVTKRWIARNSAGVAMLRANPDLFQIENHGARHVPAVIGRGRQVYGIEGVPDLAHLDREVKQGAEAVAQLTGATPRWYRGATGEYDPAALERIAAQGFRVAGFSVNADDGASLPREAILARLRRVRSGDIIIAHLNKPSSDTAEALAAGLKDLLAKGYRFVKLNDTAVRPLPGPR